MLHIHPKDKGAKKSQAATDIDTAVTSAVVAEQTGGLTGAGERNYKLSIVPVKVKSKRGHKIEETCAFLDQEKVVGSCIVSDLEIAGLDSGVY